MLDLKLTAHLAELSMLKFSEKELEKIAREMDDIAVLIDKVRDIDYAFDEDFAIASEYKTLREDHVKPSLKNEDILKNTKKKYNKSFVSPKVV